MAQGFTSEFPHSPVQGVDTEPGQDSGTLQNAQEEAQTRRSRVAGQCQLLAQDYCPRLKVDIEQSCSVRVYESLILGVHSCNFT